MFPTTFSTKAWEPSPDTSNTDHTASKGGISHPGIESKPFHGEPGLPEYIWSRMSLEGASLLFPIQLCPSAVSVHEKQMGIEEGSPGFELRSSAAWSLLTLEFPFCPRPSIPELAGIIPGVQTAFQTAASCGPSPDSTKEFFRGRGNPEPGCKADSSLRRGKNSVGILRMSASINSPLLHK